MGVGLASTIAGARHTVVCASTCLRVCTPAVLLFMAHFGLMTCSWLLCVCFVCFVCVLAGNTVLVTCQCHMLTGMLCLQAVASWAPALCPPVLQYLCTAWLYSWSITPAAPSPPLRVAYAAHAFTAVPQCTQRFEVTGPVPLVLTSISTFSCVCVQDC